VVCLELTPSVKPQRVRCKLGETIEQSCSDALVHNPDVCKGAHLYNEYLAIQDGHDSWGLCTTSAEYKTILRGKLTVMSGMDPQMIRQMMCCEMSQLVSCVSLVG
jgi:hypothetical protein